MATCNSCGTYYDSGIFTSCPTCKTHRLIQENTAATRSTEEANERLMQDMESRLEVDRFEREQMLESAIEEQRRITEEALEEQRRIAQEAAEEHRRIASEAWQLEAQKKAEQAAKLLNAGLPEECLKLSLDAISQDPTCLSAYLWIVFAYVQTSKVKEATEYTAKAIRLLETDDYKNTIRMNEGVFLCLVQVGKPQELVQRYISVLNNNSRIWEVSKLNEILQLHDNLVGKAVFEGAKVLIDNITASIINDIPNLQKNTWGVMLNIYVKKSSSTEQRLSRYWLDAANRLCSQMLNSIPATYSDQRPTLMIPLLAYNMEIDHRIGNKNDGHRINDFLNILDSGTITVSPTTNAMRTQSSGISIDPSALSMVKRDIQRTIDNDDIRLVKEAVNGIKSDNNISEATINTLKTKITERYERVWKPLFGENVAQDIKNAPIPRPGKFLSYIISVVISSLILFGLFVYVDKIKLSNTEKVAEAMGFSFGISIVIGPIISFFVLIPIFLILYPFHRVIINRKAKKAANELMKQKLDI